MLIDTHGHVSFYAFKDDADAVLQRTLEGDTWVVMPGTQFSTSKRAVELAEKYDQGVYAAIGLHPIHLTENRRVDELETQSEILQQVQHEKSWMTFQTKGEEFDYAKYKELGQSKKVVAVGECGLDYYWEPKGKEKREAQRVKQKSALALQVKLAGELGLPVILHCRKAHEDLIEFLDTRYKIQDTRLRGVVHCYTGDLKQAEQFYGLGLYFGFNGLIFKHVPALPDPKEIIAALPLERIVLETDSPYLTPAIAGTVPATLARRSLEEKRDEGGPHDERNEPLFVKYVAEEIARIKGISLEEVARVTTQNAKDLFSLDTK
ncbi:MAG: TatD family hydrolase [Candidatus Wildermuthbacteria bacterium]|nr:TatD family hydrolase [Candidatus Wildermuthbacteria bacterium]